MSMSMNVLSACTYVFHIYAQGPQTSGKGIQSPRTEAIDCCESPCGFWNGLCALQAQ